MFLIQISQLHQQEKTALHRHAEHQHGVGGVLGMILAIHFLITFRCTSDKSKFEYTFSQQMDAIEKQFPIATLIGEIAGNIVQFWALRSILEGSKAGKGTQKAGEAFIAKLGLEGKNWQQPKQRCSEPSM